MIFKKIALSIGCFAALSSFAQDHPSWEIKPVAIQTRWAKDVSPENVLKEYPRPQLVRSNWTNLNGLWDYAITNRNEARPSNYEGQILVPFPIESALSGVKKKITSEQNLWYRKKIKISRKRASRTILHFGAVDQEATVYVNGKEMGKHAGGYTAFSFDITDAIKDGENYIDVKTSDPTDQGVWPHGKQVNNPESIYYTSSSGIWQTVWMEDVPVDYIEGLTITPDIDKGTVSVIVRSAKAAKVCLTVDGQIFNGRSNSRITIPVKNARLWSPANPFLYDLVVTMGKDEVKSYFGMRKVSVGKDEKGYYRIFLNNQYLFNLGTLDQGFWPEGLYTAPTDEALKYDIEAIKAMGFNTIRKHIKVEPARWYYHADKLGMMVWQDFVNPQQALPEGSKAAFEQQLKETMEQLHNFPCITTWVLFNERWGRYDQERLTNYVKQADPSRLLNAHSGEMLWVNEKLRHPAPDAWVNSDIADVHSYPHPMNAPAMDGRVQILGEFGGIGVFIPDHQWNTGNAWGYVNETVSGLQTKYATMNLHLQLLEKEGLAGSIYTQPFDVEGEQNGLLTYDRAVIKIPFAELRKIHAPLNAGTGTIPMVTADNADVQDQPVVYAQLLQQYLDGKQTDYRKLAMMAAQTGDAAGRKRFSAMYIRQLKAPYAANDIMFVENNTSNVTDPGFVILQEEVSRTRNRALHVKLMNIIFTDIIQPLVPAPDARPDWNDIEAGMKEYGAPGLEIFMRAKTIHTLNQQDWANFTPTAKEYLARYGEFIPDNEKEMFRQQINDHP